MRYDERKEAEAFERGLNIGRLEAAKDLAAAEERGRRRGVEEAAKLFDNCRDVMFAIEVIAPSIRRLKELAPRDSAPACDAVLSSDPFREWRCGKPKGHEGPHSGDRK